jgi:hypothetical protein
VRSGLESILRLLDRDVSTGRPLELQLVPPPVITASTRSRSASKATPAVSARRVTKGAGKAATGRRTRAS